MVQFETWNGFDKVFKDVASNKRISIGGWECISCGLCVTECPSEAIGLVDDAPEFGVDIIDSLYLDTSSCSVWGECAKVCPVEAIKITDCEEESETTGEVVNEGVDVTDTYVAPETRSRTYRWSIFKQKWGLWRFDSYEAGTHKKIKVNGVWEWQWQTLAHSSVAYVGISIGGEVSVTVNNSVATVGKYHAAMKLYCSVTLSAICEEVSPITMAGYFTNTRTWNVNDTGIGV